jgi:hypothetical protein
LPSLLAYSFLRRSGLPVLVAGGLVDLGSGQGWDAVRGAQAQAQWGLGYLAGERLPQPAAAALVAGLDTPSLRCSPGLTADRMDRAAALADRALQALGCRPMATLPPAREAALWAEMVTAGAVGVLQGVGALSAVSSRTDDQQLLAALAAFAADGQRWQQAIPERRPAIGRQLVDRARAFLPAGPRAVSSRHRSWGSEGQLRLGACG